MICFIKLSFFFIFFLFQILYFFFVSIQAPRWACLLCAVGLFIYQSLDAIDGKQARRTGTSNPLGELFDHGCDSVSTGKFYLFHEVRVRIRPFAAFVTSHYVSSVCRPVRVHCSTAGSVSDLDVFPMFLCDDFVLLCSLADIRQRNHEIWSHRCYRSSVHHHPHSSCISHLRA